MWAQVKAWWQQRTWEPPPPDAGRPEVAVVAHLMEQITVPQQARSVREAVARYYRLPPEAQLAELPGLYLLLEHYLTEVDPLRTKTPPQLRAQVQAQFPTLTPLAGFEIIFATSSLQEVLLCRRYLQTLLALLLAQAGSEAANWLSDLQAWVAQVPAEATMPPHLGLEDEVPEDHRAWVFLLTRTARGLYQRLHPQLGPVLDARYTESYDVLAQQYRGLETFPAVVSLLPEALLEPEQLQLLSQRQMQRVLVDQVQRLQGLNAQLRARHQELTVAQAALEEARAAADAAAARFEAVLNTVGEAILSADAAGRIVMVNAEAEELWGYRAEEMVGQPLTLLMPPAYHARHHEGFSRYLATGEAQILGQRVEMEGQRKQGTVFPLEVQLNETRLGATLFFTAAVRDITARKRFEADLIAAREDAEANARVKTTMLNNMSHEIRTPLTGIIGFADILAETSEGEHADFAQLIGSSGRRLLATLNSVLDYAQLEAAQLQMHRTELDLVAEAKEALALLRPMAESHSLALRFEAAQLTIRASLDRAFLDRILNNLIGNAIKFTEDGHITLRVRADAQHCYLEVEDTGIGMTPAFIEQDLFEPFHQESVGEARSHRGSGLGLAITRHLVELMGGTLSVVSEKGVGSTFIVQLPRQPAASGEAT